MTCTVRIPTPLRHLAGGRDAVEVADGTVADVLDHLDRECDGIHDRIRDDGGSVRRFVNVFVDGDDIRTLEGLSTVVREGAVVSIVPAIAGGAPDWRACLEELKSTVPQVTVAEVRSMRERGEDFVLIDVREAEENRRGRIPGGQHISRGFLEMKIEEAVPDHGAKIVVHCAGGVRSLLAAQSLRRLGYADVSSMAGGFEQWQRDGLPVEVPAGLDEADMDRYQRHISIPEVGVQGQVKLLESRVLLIGAGGLGCPVGYYLAAAGVGTIGIVDGDVVDLTNLQRQILHTADRVGMAKTESARRTLVALNPGIELVPIHQRLTSANVGEIFDGWDLVVDGSDNFLTRYLVNDACVKFGIPCVHGSVYRFEGQVTVFKTPEGPCYRCLYPEPPPPGMAPSCADAGVLGVLPGVIGLLEAVEAVKLILGLGDTLVGRLLQYDALRAEFRELRIRRDPNCAYCAEGVEFPGFIDYEHFCASSHSTVSV